MIRVISVLILLIVNSVLMAQEYRLGLPLGHVAEISTIEFSQNGDLLVSASEDQTARLWSVKEAKLLYTLNHNAPVKQACFINDDQQILTIAYDKVKLWDVKSGQLIRQIIFDASPVLTAGIRNNQTLIVATVNAVWQYDDILTSSTGIVGKMKYQYDLWGDTVNTASRMESHGEVGKVNVSQATYEIIIDDPQFVFEHRGKVSAKGIGEITMYFVSRSFV